MRGRSVRTMDIPESYIRMWHDAYKESTSTTGPVRFDYEHEGKGWLSVTVNNIGSSAERTTTFSLRR